MLTTQKIFVVHIALIKQAGSLPKITKLRRLDAIQPRLTANETKEGSSQPKACIRPCGLQPLNL